MRPICSHKTTKDFVVGYDRESGRQIWKCSHCGVESVWIDGQWQYFGTGECKNCWSPEIEFVTCGCKEQSE